MEHKFWQFLRFSLIDAIIPTHINYIHIYDNLDIMTKKIAKLHNV